MQRGRGWCHPGTNPRRVGDRLIPARHDEPRFHGLRSLHSFVNNELSINRGRCTLQLFIFELAIQAGQWYEIGDWLENKVEKYLLGRIQGILSFRASASSYAFNNVVAEVTVPRVLDDQVDHCTKGNLCLPLRVEQKIRMGFMTECCWRMGNS